MIMRYLFRYILSLLLVASCLSSCTSTDEWQSANDQARHTCRMYFNGSLSGYEGEQTRAAMSLPDGAVMYLRFGANLGTAVYHQAQQEWSLTYTGNLNVGSGACTVRYFRNPVSSSNAEVVLSPTTALYETTSASYSLESDGSITVKGELNPVLSRVRFQGQSGTELTVGGITTYGIYDVQSGQLNPTTAPVRLSVGSAGYTPNVYFLAASEAPLSITTDAGLFTAVNRLQGGGKSYSITIPSPEEHIGWIKGGEYPTIYEYVDLGLSVKWATCNVGASSPEDYGDYFAWGETEGYLEGKTYFGWSTYKWMEDGYSDWKHVNKYQRADGQTSAIWYKNGTFVGDNKTVLDPEDDVAHVKWGGSWRMPTIKECDELINNCTWTWTTQNGVTGYIVTSKTNGNSIFLPTAGYRSDSYFLSAGSYGFYYSSSLSTSYTYSTCELGFNSGLVCRGGTDRYYGRPVRPVWAEDVKVSSIVVTTSKTEINVGESLQLFAEVSPSNATNMKVIWSSNNTNVATVSADGLVTAKQPGTVTITASATDGSGVKANYTLTIVQSNSSTSKYEYVDLGLSVKWATCNVGASSPEDYGDYFAWGETTGYLEGKTIFNWDTYKWMEDGYSDWSHVNKYQCADGQTSAIWYKNGTFVGDNKTVLDPEDDVAHVKWGGEWRMPTDAEFTELRKNCTWTWTTQNGVIGYIVTSKTNGNSIFLPAAGCRYGSNFRSTGSGGGFWSSSLYTSRSYYAYGLNFSSGSVGRDDYYGRYFGRSVRPVCPQP